MTVSDWHITQPCSCREVSCLLSGWSLQLDYTVWILLKWLHFLNGKHPVTKSNRNISGVLFNFTQGLLGIEVIWWHHSSSAACQWSGGKGIFYFLFFFTKLKFHLVALKDSSSPIAHVSSSFIILCVIKRHGFWPKSRDSTLTLEDGETQTNTTLFYWTVFLDKLPTIKKIKINPQKNMQTGGEKNAIMETAAVRILQSLSPFSQACPAEDMVRGQRFTVINYYVLLQINVYYSNSIIILPEEKDGKG